MFRFRDNATQKKHFEDIWFWSMDIFVSLVRSKESYVKTNKQTYTHVFLKTKQNKTHQSP